MERVQLVLWRYKEHGVKLTHKKCELFKPTVKFLGKLVTGEGYTMAPAEMAVVRALQERTPATVGDLSQGGQVREKPMGAFRNEVPQKVKMCPC